MTFYCRNLLEDSIRVVLSVDFPENWPNLGELIMSYLTSNDSDKIISALLALVAIIKRYDKFSKDTSSNLFNVVEATFPILYQLICYLQTINSIESYEIQSIIIKIFWSSSTFGIPPSIQVHNVFESWMQVMIDILSTPEPIGISFDPKKYVKRQKLPWWISKKWILYIWIRLNNRYLKNNLKEEKDFCEYFTQTFPMQFISKIFEILNNVILSNIDLPDKVISLILDYIHSSIVYPSLWAHIQPHIWDLTTKLFIPILSFNHRDLELFEYDPQTYILRQQDPLADETDPRTPIFQILHLVSTLKGSNYLEQLVSYLITEIMNPYLKSEPSTRDFRLRYACLDILGNLSLPIKKSPVFSTILEQLLVEHIYTDMVSAPYFIQSKACWIFSRYCSIEFQDNQNLINGTQNIIYLILNSENLPVLVDAAISLFDAISNPNLKTIIGPSIGKLVYKFLYLIQQIDSDALVSTLQNLIRYYPSPVLNFSSDLIISLSKSFFKAFNLSNSDPSLGNNAIDTNESDSNLYDTAFLTADQILQTINTLYKSIRKSKKMYQILEPYVIPVIKLCLSNQGSSLLENALLIMVEISYYTPKPFSKNMWELWTMICQAYLTFAPDYMQNMLPTLDNFISFDTNEFVQNQNHLQLVYEMAEKYLKQRNYPEIDLLELSRLFEVILLNCKELVDFIVEPLLKLVVQRIFVGGSIPLQVVLLKIILNSLWYNPMITCQVLESNQWTQHIFQLIFRLVVENEFVRVCDKKTASLGLSSMLRLNYNQLPAYIKEKMSEVTITLLQLTQNSEEQRIEEDLYEEDEEDEEDLNEEYSKEDEYGFRMPSEDEDDLDFEEIDIEKLPELEDYSDPYTTLGNMESTFKANDLKNIDDGNLADNDEEDDEKYEWTLYGQDESSELPTKNINEIVYLAETLQNFDPNVLNSLISSFDESIKKLYNHINEVANDKLEKSRFVE